jgi:hypothetical protein
MYNIKNLIEGLKSLKMNTEFCLGLDYWERYAWELPRAERNNLPADEFVKQLFESL